MDEPAYHCLAGHDVPLDQLDECTEVRCLDDGADIRVCKEHGTAIRVSATGTRTGPDLRL